MTQLPVTYRGALETEALAFACKELAYFRDHKIPFLGFDVNWVDKSDVRKVAQQAMKMSTLLDAHNMMTLTEYARAGWDLAQEALQDILLEYDNRGVQPPTYLASYRMEIVKGNRRRIPARKRADNFLRDMVITHTVANVIKKFGLKPTRSPASPRQSACSVVAEAVTLEGVGSMGERAVVAIWTRLSPKFDMEMYAFIP